MMCVFFVMICGMCIVYGFDGVFELIYDVCGMMFVECVMLVCGDDVDVLMMESGWDDDGTMWDVDWYGDRRVMMFDGVYVLVMMMWVCMN